MIRWSSAFLVCVILAGCYVDQSTQVYNNEAVQYDASNHVVLMPGKRLYATFEQINQYYVETEQCMGLYATGPTIWYIDFQEWSSGIIGQDAGTGSWGLTGPGTGVEYLQAAGMLPSDYEAPYGTSGFVFINNNEHIVPGITYDYRSEETDRQVLKHEFIHHIINQYGGTDDGSSHGLLGGVNYFEKCGPGVDVFL